VSCRTRAHKEVHQMGRNEQIVAYLNTDPDRHGKVCVTFTSKLANIPRHDIRQLNIIALYANWIQCSDDTARTMVLIRSYEPVKPLMHNATDRTKDVGYIFRSSDICRVLTSLRCSESSDSNQNPYSSCEYYNSPVPISARVFERHLARNRTVQKKVALEHPTKSPDRNRKGIRSSLVLS